MTGPELTHLITEYLAGTGWVYRVMNHNRQTPRGAAGLSDVLAWKQGVCLLIEVKSGRDTIRPSQAKFREELAPHLAFTLRYVEAHCLEDVQEAAER